MATEGNFEMDKASLITKSGGLRNIFRGCVLYLDRVPVALTRQLYRYLIAFGAIVRMNICPDVTHIVTTRHFIDKELRQLKANASPSAYIVCVEWVYRSIRSGIMDNSELNKLTDPESSRPESSLSWSSVK